MLPEASRPKAGQIGLAFPWHLSDKVNSHNYKGSAQKS
jgi:hypothetical protein